MNAALRAEIMRSKLHLGWLPHAKQGARCKLAMISRLITSLTVALFIAALFAPSTLAQIRGMSSRGPHAGAAFRPNGKGRLVRGARHHSRGWFFYPYYDSDYEQDEFDREQFRPEVPPGNVVPDERPVAAAHPVESLILENRDGQWIRIPTGSQVPIGSQNSTSQSNLGTGITAPKGAFQPPIKLPPAVLVFRDGHHEEVERYVVQGDVLYTRSDYWSTGSWTRKIPISELDVPGTVKLNAANGGSFSLPSRPYEVVVRF